MPIHKRIKVGASQNLVSVGKVVDRVSVHVHAICWNEEKLMPFFLRHYSSFCDKIFIYDNKSTDRSVEIAKKNPKVVVESYSTDNQIRDDKYLLIKNNSWKHTSKGAHYVIVCDMDEFVYHENISDKLKDFYAKGYSLIKTDGFNMISENYPETDEQLTSIVKNGVRFEPYSKICIFDPAKIRDINFSAGCHQIRPRGDCSLHVSDIKLLHYKFLGRDEYVKRQLQYKQRMSKINIQNGWGAHYLHEENYFRAIFDGTKKTAKKVI